MEQAQLSKLFEKFRAGIDNEAVIRWVYERVLRPGDYAVDIGAHDGLHTLPMAHKVAPSGHVHAFEPLPACQVRLQDKLAGSPLSALVSLYPYALSDVAGPSSFVVALDDLPQSGLRERMYDKPTRLFRAHVAVTTLDGFGLPLPSLRFVKIDVEGAELHALRGAEALLRAHRPLIAFEFGERSFEGYGTTRKAMFEFLQGLGYSLCDVKANEIPDVESFTRGAGEHYVWDYFALPEEHRALASQLKAVYAQQLAYHDGLPEGGYRTELTVEDPAASSRPLELRAKERREVALRLGNRGVCELSPISFLVGKGVISLGILWFPLHAGRERSALAAEHRAQLPGAIPPGGEISFSAALEASVPPGDYEVWLGLVHEGITWFYERGDAVLKLRVRVS